MIHWLVQSAQQGSDLARGVSPPNLLHPAEQRRLALLKTSKRRRDWLLGRWTAKQLLQACIEHEMHLRLPLSDIAIYNDTHGAPVAMADCGTRIAEWIVSISHGHSHAFCAATPFISGGLGADIERIEPRAWCFVEDYFTPDEIERVCCAPLEKREILITAIWSAKEAVLKALRLGLTIDTRQVSCAIDPWHYSEQSWIEFGVTCLRTSRPSARGWWRIWDDCVLTLALT